MNETYRSHFTDARKAESYDEQQYALRSYGTLLWEIEKEYLTALASEFRQSHDSIDYLDFAAGTGRVLSFMEDKVDSATGIEIAEPMAERARQRVRKANVIIRDITADDAPIENTYDLITAFRFVLNADPELQLAGLKALAARLKDESSWLIFNNHANLWSHKLLMWPYHRVRRLSSGRPLQGNTMTGAEVRRLADEAGLRLERALGCGILGDKLTRRFSPERTLPWERSLASRKLLSRVGVNQMYVAVLKK